jgi:hypothetical protein
LILLYSVCFGCPLHGSKHRKIYRIKSIGDWTLLCLKGEAYLYARLGEPERATVLLEKIIKIDTQDRLGAAALLTVVNGQ